MQGLLKFPWKGGNPLDMDFDFERFTCTGLETKYSTTGVWKSHLCEGGAVPPVADPLGAAALLASYAHLCVGFC